jgi:hypothetical protein
MDLSWVVSADVGSVSVSLRFPLSKPFVSVGNGVDLVSITGHASVTVCRNGPTQPGASFEELVELVCRPDGRTVASGRSNGSVRLNLRTEWLGRLWLRVDTSIRKAEESSKGSSCRN